ncbi:MAG: hypothetical protein RI554_10675 [Trueperaceae bacterium]|nr:hypothetical protein [Trueperaceae bacterium]
MLLPADLRDARPPVTPHERGDAAHVPLPAASGASERDARTDVTRGHDLPARGGRVVPLEIRRADRAPRTVGGRADRALVWRMHRRHPAVPATGYGAHRDPLDPVVGIALAASAPAVRTPDGPDRVGTSRTGPTAPGGATIPIQWAVLSGTSAGLDTRAWAVPRGRLDAVPSTPSGLGGG